MFLHVVLPLFCCSNVGRASVHVVSLCECDFSFVIYCWVCVVHTQYIAIAAGRE